MQPQQPPDNTALSARCANALNEIARRAHVTTRSEGATLIANGKRLSISAVRENEARSQDAYLAGIAVTVTVDQQPGLKFGSVGVGSSPDDAIQTAVDEWAQLAGVAIIRANCEK